MQAIEKCVSKYQKNQLRFLSDCHRGWQVGGGEAGDGVPGELLDS